MKSWTQAPAASVALALGAAVAIAAGFAPSAFAQTRVLGPEDGHDLPATDLERVAVGAEAPLFALESFGGGTVALAEYRGVKNVVLVFYRGHW